MMTSLPTDGGSRGLRILAEGTLAGLVSAAVLAWRGRRETGSAAAPINAVSHWIWPQEALQRDDMSARHTLTGGVIHLVSSMLWAAVYQTLRGRRLAPTSTNACTDAAAVTALAAVVDLGMVPQRLTPGFERRLTPGGLVMVYGGFALGLALGEAWRERRFARG